MDSPKAEVDGMNATITVTDRDGKPVKHIETAGAVYVSGEVSAEWDLSTSRTHGAVCAHSNIRFEDGKAICESCGEALKLAPAPSPHVPATPPQEG